MDVLSVYHDLLYQPAIGPLLLMARVTETIRLGPAALNPFTLHPYEIAGQIAMLDAVSGGRAYLGLAKGAWLDRLGLVRGAAAGRTAARRWRSSGRCWPGTRGGIEGERFTLAPGTDARLSASARVGSSDDRDVGARHRSLGGDDRGRAQARWQRQPEPRVRSHASGSATRT